MRHTTPIAVLFSLMVLICLPAVLFAQAPYKMNYQSIVRDNGGTIITNQNVSFRMSILEGNINGTEVYAETHQVATNDFGYAGLVIGDGQIVLGVFDEITWDTNQYFLKTEVDVTGGANFTEMGTSQLVSVPYALYANEAGSSNDGKTYLTLYRDITANEAIEKIEKDLGPSTQFIRVENTTQISTLNLGSVTDIEGLQIRFNSGLTTIDLSSLRTLGGSVANGGGGLIDENEGLINLDLSNLEFVAKDLGVNGCPLLQTLNLSSLRSTSEVAVTNCSTLSSLNLLNLESCYASLIIRNNENLNNIDLPSFDFGSITSTISFEGNSLSSAGINAFLSAFVNANLSDLVILLHDQIPPAPPTGQGLIDKQTLIDNGNIVLTD